jgi:5'(3')-deoxyribonucleotidase
LEAIRSPDEPEITAVNMYDFENKCPHIKNRMRLIKRQVGWWSNLPVIESGMQILNLAKQVGFDIHILTKGPDKISNAWKEKVDWVHEHLGYDVNIHVTSDKSLTYGKVLFDDYPEYMAAWLKWRPRGLGIMPVTSYNTHYTHPNVIKWDGTNVEEVTQALKLAYERQFRAELSVTPSKLVELGE